MWNIDGEQQGWGDLSRHIEPMRDVGCRSRERQ